MSSTIQVKAKTVNNREVISFSKLYGGEEHEVFAPTNQGTQVMLSLLSIINDGKDEDEQFVFVRKRDLGGVGEVDTVQDGNVVKRQAVGAVVETFWDDNKAIQVQNLLNDYE